MTSTTCQYAIEPYTPEDEPQVLDLLEESLGDSISHWQDGRLWRWKHFANPFGPSYILVARSEEGQVLGLRALMSWSLTSGSHTLKAYRPVDTVTHPDYRGYGIFPQLTKKALADARSEGVHFFFNTPNSMSLPGYLKMGSFLLTEAYLSFKVVNWPSFALRSSRHLLARRLGRAGSSNGLQWPGNLAARNLAVSDDRLRRLIELEGEWQKQNSQIRVSRSVEYLLWRYADDPVQNHWVVWSDSDSAIEGVCFVRPTASLGSRGAVIEDIFLASPDEQHVRRLLKRIRDSLGIDLVQAYFSPDSFYGQTLRRLGFRQIARNGMNVVVNPLSDAFDLRQSHNWALSLGDLELF